MGILYNVVRAWSEAHSQGVSFRHTLTLGRQTNYCDLDDLLAILGTTIDRQALEQAAIADYCEPILRLLGAESVDSLDVSAYEGATLIHDLNQPIPDAWKGHYDCVIDCGTLEHVFDFPTVIRNCMELVRVGGHLLIETPANNQCGHGFYQFSPELFYRVLSPANGYEVEAMHLYENYAGATWYRVPDPDSVRSRVELTNSLPTMLAVRARRVSDVSILTSTPQQSDYSRLWDSGTRPARVMPPRHPIRSAARRALMALAPSWTDQLRRAVQTWRVNRSGHTSLHSSRFYHPAGR